MGQSEIDMGMWKTGAAAAVLLTFTGCFGGGFGGNVVGVRPDRPPDSGMWETGDVDTEDTEGPAGPSGALSVAYTFDPGLLGVTTCAEADLDTISLVLIPSGGEARDPIVFPCLGQELRAYDIAIGLYEVQVVGGVAPDVTWESVPTSAYVTEDAVEDVPVLLACQSNGVEDGCGGA